MIKLFKDFKFQLSWGKLRREPATRWFDWSFAPIPTFDERFARQYRYEPPPEFPLASPYAGIVHHLSGPNRCAPTQVFHVKEAFIGKPYTTLLRGQYKTKPQHSVSPTDPDWSMVQYPVHSERCFPVKKEQQVKKQKTHPTCYFHFASMVLLSNTIILAHMLDSLVRVTRRVDWVPLMPGISSYAFFWRPQKNQHLRKKSIITFFYNSLLLEKWSMT